ncbi:MAG: hypothetical protein IKP41_02805, partial [Bacteroidaceae bacterium]|nr:hypothetical protein [Bacteroidaceae bacterium]
GTAIGLSFWGAIDINLLVGVGISAILVGTFLTKEKGTYWETVFEFMGSKTAMTATLLWLIVGVYGNILKEGHIVEGLVWAAHQLDINATGFTLVVFLFSSLFAVSTGSGFGTISAMSLTLFPAGIALGADPALLGGAILSGAALGDSIAPVSDTAVIAATTQEYADGKESADIGGTVKKRLPLALTALAVALIAYGITGGFHTATSIAALDNTSEHPQGLALLIPTLVVILLSFRKVNIFVALAVGLAVAVGIGLTFNLFTLGSLICVENGKVGGAIVEGIGGMANICILLMVVVSLSGLIIRSGGMDGITGSLNAHVIRSPKGAELAIFGLVSIAGILIAAVNTIANICIAPFVNSIGKQHGLHPYRRATLLATVICTFPFVLPYGGCVLLLQKGIEASGCGMGIQATDVFFTAFYPWALLAVMLVVCLTGYQREKNITDERTDETDTK